MGASLGLGCVVTGRGRPRSRSLGIEKETSVGLEFQMARSGEFKAFRAHCVYCSGVVSITIISIS